MDIEKIMQLAKQGDAVAQCKLGLYFLEDGPHRNDDEAVSFFIRSVQQGNADAQFSLGECYNFGRGVYRSEEDALDLYVKAASHGHEKAKQRIKEFDDKNR